TDEKVYDFCNVCLLRSVEALSDNSMRINDHHIQRYYLPTNKKHLTSELANNDFRQLLLQKINMAMDLNSHLNNSSNDRVASTFLPNFMSVFNMQQPFNGMSMINNLSANVHIINAYVNQTMHPQQHSEQYSTFNTRTNKVNRPTKYNHIINEAAKKYNIDERLIHAIIKTESNYNPNATSHAGAAGLMQLMPGTAKYLGVNNRYDIRQNIFGGTKYIND